MVCYRRISINSLWFSNLSTIGVLCFVKALNVTGSVHCNYSWTSNLRRVSSEISNLKQATRTWPPILIRFIFTNKSPHLHNKDSTSKTSSLLSALKESFCHSSTKKSFKASIDWCDEICINRHKMEPWNPQTHSPPLSRKEKTEESKSQVRGFYFLSSSPLDIHLNGYF